MTHKEKFSWELWTFICFNDGIETIYDINFGLYAIPCYEATQASEEIIRSLH